jgi:hypothetical protein
MPGGADYGCLWWIAGVAILGLIASVFLDAYLSTGSGW